MLSKQFKNAKFVNNDLIHFHNKSMKLLNVRVVVICSLICAFRLFNNIISNFLPYNSKQAMKQA